MQWRVGEMTGVDSLRSNESHVKPEGEAMHVASSPALEAQRNINPGGGGGEFYLSMLHYACTHTTEGEAIYTCRVVREELTCAGLAPELLRSRCCDQWDET